MTHIPRNQLGLVEFDGDCHSVQNFFAGILTTSTGWPEVSAARSKMYTALNSSTRTTEVSLTKPVLMLHLMGTWQLVWLTMMRCPLDVLPMLQM